MNKVILTFIFGVAVLIGLSAFFFVLPFYYYEKQIHNELKSRWYILDHYDAQMLRPSRYQIEDVGVNNLNSNLWQKFNFTDLNIPLPFKNPLFFVVPKLEYEKKIQKTKIGISILNASNTKISEIIFLPNRPMPNYLSSQPLFELPLVRNIIENKYTIETIWEDVFTKRIGDWNIKLDEMIYNLYLLEFRSKFLKSTSLKFGFIKEINKAVIELKSRDKDYKVELIVHKRGAVLSSFVIKTLKSNETSQIIRYKMLKDMEYMDSSEALSDILYKEFKGLRYKDQVDHVGMLYLLSAWSHDESKKELLESAIMFLERGKGNEKQLEQLYNYYYSRYGTVFSKRFIDGVDVKSKIRIEQRIILQENERKRRLKNEVPIIPAKTKETLENEFDELIEETKKSEKSNNKIRID